MLEGFRRNSARISASSDSSAGLISTSAGTGKGDGGISTERETTTLTAKGVMERPRLVGLTLKARPETCVSK